MLDHLKKVDDIFMYMYTKFGKRWTKQTWDEKKDLKNILLRDTVELNYMKWWRKTEFNADNEAEKTGQFTREGQVKLIQRIIESRNKCWERLKYLYTYLNLFRSIYLS